MSEIFPNSKPILLGESEDSIGIIDTPAVAGLAGDVAVDITDFSNFDFAPNVGSHTSTATETIIATTTVTNSFEKNTLSINVIIQGTSGFGSNFSLCRLRRGGLTGTILASGNVNGTGTRIFNVDDIDIPIGDTDYVLTNQEIAPSNDHAVGTYSAGMSGIVVLSEADDTHAAIIATPATATKQIISEDSHRTHETEVLP